MHNERRKHRRYRVKDNVFTVINPDPVKVVPIIDIGMGGLGVYLDDGARWMDTSSQLEIMVADCSFYLEKLPFQIAASVKAFPKDTSNLMDGRRYGIKFGNLQPGQESHLKYLIRHYTEKGSLSQIIYSLSRILDPIRAPKPSTQVCNSRIWQSLHRPSL